MAERPIILTVFSDVEDPNPLPRLVEERDEIIDLLKTPDQQKRIEHKYLSVKDGEQLMAYIRTYREEIFIFHYGGHADSTMRSSCLMEEVSWRALPDTSEL
jgi:hypothetical protein